jgi:hypothetical protein
MNAFTRLLTALPFITSASLFAAPSVQMPHEWAAPLDGGKALILVQTETGQARVLRFSGAFAGIDSGPIQTNLPGVTGLNTGLNNAGNEHAIISSTTANSIRLLNTDTTDLTTIQPVTPGPVTAIPLRQLTSDPPAIHNLSKYGDAAETLQKYTDLFTGAPSPQGSTISLFPVNDLQPSLDPTALTERLGLASILASGQHNLYEVRAIPGNVQYSYLTGGGTPGEKIASLSLGNDARLCAIRYQPGATAVNVVTLPYNGFPIGHLNSNVLPFPIGSITAVAQGVANAPHGVLITSQDGNTAIYAHISGGQNLITQATFTPQGANKLNGIIPVPGRGFVLLEGPALSRKSTSWRGFSNSGLGWAQASSGSFSAWLPPQQNFATMFWFNGAPLVDPKAEMIKLETRADWTRKTSSAPIPPQIELSDLLAPGQGLTPSSLVAPTAPAGATHLITSQHESGVSISALDTDIAIQSPSLSISPPSGDYDSSITVTALYDSGANELFYRENLPGSPWQSFENITIGYPSTWLFYAKNLNTEVAGPIISRSFTFSSINPNSLDADQDGVPDYVERSLGLDPGSGADHDGDFQSDLEEILAGTLADDHLSNTPPGVPRTPPFLGQGFELIAQAFNATGQGASPYNEFLASTTEDDFPGETLRAFDMHGNLVAEENVIELTTPPALAGQDGAFMAIGSPISERAWITLTSPTSFAVLDVLNPSRTGREVLKVMQRPTNPVASVVTVPSGLDRDVDTAAWIAAAQAAHGSHVTVSALTGLNPGDNAVSALAEQALFSSLQTLDAGLQTELGVPATIGEFTLFPNRRGETSRVGFSKEMFQALINSGCDFPAMLALLEGASANATVLALANSIASLHAANSDTKPLMALPLDAFRAIIQTGGIVDPAPGDPARPDPYLTIPPASITSVKSTLDSLLGQVAGTKRPTATWQLVIGPSTTPLHQYDYLLQGTADKIWLLDHFGDRQLLEQGLGLALGSVFEVTGFTDVTVPAGFTGLEFIRIESVVTPLASDTDANGNLLDDGWENVFFGDLGVIGPFDPHPVTGHSYLQYHLSGADPRSGSLATPILNLIPDGINLVWVPAATAYNLHFTFPAEFQDRFDFALESSSTLAGFTGPANTGALVEVSPGNYRFRIKIAESNLDTNFFRIGISLKN